MSDWSAGYVAELGYTYGYYTELNPLRINLAFLNRGLAAPNVRHACELGFGQGMSVNIHAAGTSVQWHGTDFNPSQAAFAEELSQIADSGANLKDAKFSDFSAIDDLPEFDFIGLHGIWSWISDENRRVIVDFLSKKLKVGGVLYISYNTLPGWSAFAPIRHLMTEHADVLGAQGLGIVSRIDEAINFADNLLKTNPLFARANPVVAERLERLKTQNRHYLAHEYFNRDWHPMHFATMADWLADAKLQFAGSAHYLDHVESINMSEEQQQFLAAIPDSSFRESVRDFMVNQQFRRDYWVKGLRRITPLEQAEQLRKQRVVLTTHRGDVSMTVNGALGEANLSESVYAPLLDYLADHKVHTIADIERTFSAEQTDQPLTLGQITQAVMVLSGAGSLGLAQSDNAASSAKSKTDKLNLHLFNKARSSGDIGFVASPVTGGGVPLNRFEQLFTASAKHGGTTASELAESVWGILSSQGQRLVKEGQQIESPEDNLAELTRQAEEFTEKKLPVLQALLVV